MIGRIQRLSAVALAVALVLGNMTVCASWAPTPEARFACCVENDSCPMHPAESHAGHHSPAMDQTDADRCCASSERDNSVPSSAAFAFASPIAAVVSPVLYVVSEPPVSLTAWRLLVPSPPADVPKHVLLSVFLV